MTGDIILQLEDVRKSFGGLRALDGVTFDVREGELVGLIGPNGCGKSTTFNAISSIIPADSGSIKLFDKEISRARIDLINLMGMSRTFQNTRLWRNLTVIENLMLPPKDQAGSTIINAIFRRRATVTQEEELLEKAYETLDFLEITHMAHNYCSELSGGQSKLVDIGRVLMSDPKVLLLDEPVAGVAGPLAEKIFANISKLRKSRGITVVIIEHNMEFILRRGVDRVFVMSTGKVIAKGTPNEIKQNQSVIEAYLGE